MVDKLRKFGEMLWLNKERFILVAMVAILCFQVYKVLYPDDKPSGVTPLPPKALNDSFEAPPLPAPEPPITVSGDYVSLYRRNPFWYFSGRNQRGTTTDDKSYEIALVGIQTTGSGEPRAQLRTAATTKWYGVGDSFEQFRLQSVDASAQTAVVYVESLGRDVTLQME